MIALRDGGLPHVNRADPPLSGLGALVSATTSGIMPGGTVGWLPRVIDLSTTARITALVVM